MTFKKDSIRAVVYAALLAFAIALPIVVHADSISPDAILANPGQYDTQSITVTGTAKNVTTRQGRRGTITRYDLCGTACIHVFDFSGTAVTEGASTTATGTFHAKAPTRGGGFGSRGGSRGGSHGPQDNTLFVGAPGGFGGQGGPGGPGGPGGGAPPSPAPSPTP